MPSIREDPYSGLAVSVATSNIVPMHDADTWSFNWYVTNASASTVTCQITNAGPTASDINASAWSSAFTARGASLAPIVGLGQVPVRFARFIRNPSGGSVAVDLAKVTFR